MTAFLVFVTVAFIAVIAGNSWHTRAVKLRDTKVYTSNMARALAQHAQDTIEGIDNALVGLVERVEQSGLDDAARRERMHRFLAHTASERPQINSIFIYNVNGSALASSQDPAQGNLNVGAEEYFAFHRTFADRGPHIGLPVRSFPSAEWVIPISRRVDDAQGRFAGVVLATMRTIVLRDFYESFDIGDSGAILLANDTGTLFVRRPFDDAAIGADIRTGVVFRMYASHGSAGTALLVSGTDRTERMYSYSHLDGYPLLIAAGLSTEEVLADWRGDTARLFAGSAFVIVFLWLLGFRLRRQIGVGEQARIELRAAKADLERSNGDLAMLALQDGLTGLGNRRQFDAAVALEYARATRTGESLALIMLDVDHFKKYNDAYGHPQGDECLKRVSRALDEAVGRSADLAARYGGEEFVVLLPGTGIEGAVVIAERIRAAIEHMGIAHATNPGGVVTVSAGVAAVFPAVADTGPQGLISAADEALYAAKEAGRNRVSDACHFPDISTR